MPDLYFYCAQHIINNSKTTAESSSIHLYFLIVTPATVSQTDRQTDTGHTISYDGDEIKENGMGEVYGTH